MHEQPEHKISVFAVTHLLPPRRACGLPIFSTLPHLNSVFHQTSNKQLGRLALFLTMASVYRDERSALVPGTRRDERGDPARSAGRPAGHGLPGHEGPRRR